MSSPRQDHMPHESEIDGESPVVSVIVPARDAEETLAGLLDALGEQDIREPFEVILVDNGSLDGTRSLAEGSRLPGLRIKGRERGDGPGAARNDGAAVARAAVLAFTDADCEPARDWLREGLRAILSEDVVQGAVRPDPDATVMPFDHTVWVESESGLFETANLFVRRDAFERVGGFEDISLTADRRPFGEDAWLGWRLRRAGARFKFAPEVAVAHAVVSRGPLGYLRERSRLARFPVLVKRIPELRDGMFARFFLTSRTAAFDLAVVAALIAGLAGSPWPLLGALPYLATLFRATAGWRRHAPYVALVQLGADTVGLGALLAGSIRARTLLV